jgi:hypothetical protein
MFHIWNLVRYFELSLPCRRFKVKRKMRGLCVRRRDERLQRSRAVGMLRA